MDIRKLLFVTKFEDLRFDALQSLLDLRKVALNHVVLLNVIDREKVAMRRGTGYQKEQEVRLREKANIRFIDWAETLFEMGMEVGVYIVVGGFVKQVIQAAEKEEVDLIVIGPSRQGKMEQLISGSDLTEILSRTGVPILVYKNRSRDGVNPEKPFECPMLATNWSSASRNALDFLKKLNIAKKVHVVHVADEKSLDGTSAMEVQRTRKESRQKLDEICDILEDAGIDGRSHVYIGDTIAEIEKAAEECQATMIITGASNRSWNSWRERLLGSIPKELAEHSAFSTLIFPPEKKE